MSEEDLILEHQRQLESNDSDELRQDQEEELEGTRTLQNKIEENQDEETRQLRSEIFSHCCKNSFGFLHSVIGVSDTSLEWYKIIQHIVPRMNTLDEFLKKERTENNVGKILPSNFNI
jgi:hypothetical protein